MINSMVKLEIAGHKVCPGCGTETEDCPGCSKVYDYCQDCGEALALPEAYIILTSDRYRGVDIPPQDTATLMVDCVKYASVHIDISESKEEGGDIAYLFLHSDATEQEAQKSEITAKIIAVFAKWVRFKWATYDKISELPTLVRLLGTKVNTDVPIEHPRRFENFIALRDATKIGVEHLAQNFTWIEPTDANQQ